MRVKKVYAAPSLCAVLFSAFLVHGQEAIIADHTVTGIRRIEHIPLEWIRKARDSLKIAYGHTSHGSQIRSGLNAVEREYGDEYDYSTSDGESVLFVAGRGDCFPTARDLGSPNRTAWSEDTRNFLNDADNGKFNVVMWSWCGQVGTTEETLLETYLQPMAQLEEDFSDVMFVYMTGHLNGRGIESNRVYDRNQQIRRFCKDGGRILFDFADIESYTPAGLDVRALQANDGCEYDYDGDGERDANWANDWCEAHPGDCYYSGSCSHSRSLNCQLKGEAAWWMFAKMVGWEGFDGAGAKDAARNDHSSKVNQVKALGNAPVVMYDIRGRLLATCTTHEIDAVLSRVGSHNAMIIHSADGKRMHIMHPRH